MSSDTVIVCLRALSISFPRFRLRFCLEQEKIEWVTGVQWKWNAIKEIAAGSSAYTLSASEKCAFVGWVCVDCIRIQRNARDAHCSHELDNLVDSYCWHHPYHFCYTYEYKYQTEWLSGVPTHYDWLRRTPFGRYYIVFLFNMISDILLPFYLLLKI